MVVHLEIFKYTNENDNINIYKYSNVEALIITANTFLFSIPILYFATLLSALHSPNHVYFVLNTRMQIDMTKELSAH